MAEIKVASQATSDQINVKLDSIGSNTITAADNAAEVSSLMYIDDLVTNGENSYVHDDEDIKTQLFYSKRASRSGAIREFIYDFGRSKNLPAGVFFNNTIGCDYFKNCTTESDILDTMMVNNDSFNALTTNSNALELFYSKINLVKDSSTVNTLFNHSHDALLKFLCRSNSTFFTNVSSLLSDATYASVVDYTGKDIYSITYESGNKVAYTGECICAYINYWHNSVASDVSKYPSSIVVYDNTSSIFTNTSIQCSSSNMHILNVSRIISTSLKVVWSACVNYTKTAGLNRGNGIMIYYYPLIV